MDPLRAGHVAILGGRFHYFCDSRCKQAYSTMRAPASTLSPDEIATQEPPPVLFIESGPRRMPAPSSTTEANGKATNGTHANGAYANGHATPEPSFPEPSVTRPRLAITNEAEPDADEIIRTPRSAVAAIEPPPAPALLEPEPRPAVASTPYSPSVSDEPPPPRTLRSTADSGASAPVLPARSPTPPPVASAPVSRRIESRAVHTALRGVSIAGIVAGVLVPALGLLGATVEPVRLALALLATAALVARFALQRRDRADVHPLAIVLPVAGAAAAACWARITHERIAVGVTVFAGVSAAAALGVELLLSRARAALDASRDRIARGLDVDVKVLRGDAPIAIRADEVKPGETILVETGDVLGVDAVITAGEATVVPWLDANVETVKREGDAIVAGARVIAGRLRAMTTWAGAERAWAKLTLVDDLRIDVTAPVARATRLAIERGAPIAAALVGVAAFANGAHPVAVFSAACAAAFGVAASGVASIVAIHHARAHFAALAAGIVYKDARAFDRAGAADVAMLCARGTVLMGEPEIVTIEPLGNATVGHVLALAAGAESASTHPFAAAILRAARARGERPDDVRNAIAQAGLGVTALAASGERLVVGSRALMLKERISVAVADARINELEAQGRSVLLVAIADKLVGMLALQDGLRAGARAAVQHLLDARMEPVLLSGEARETCETIGRALDIDHIRPEVLPSDRGAEVGAVGEGGHTVAVVGHPTSDDNALGAADVAVAMLAAGSTPGEWAVSLASDDVRDAASALTIPHKTRDRVRAALAIGFVPGILALLAVAFGLAPLAVAPVAAFAGAVSVLVHGNRDAAKE